MTAKIVNLANPDEAETLCATVEEAEQALAAMVKKIEIAVLQSKRSASSR